MVKRQNLCHNCLVTSILQRNAPELREKSAPVAVNEINSPRIKSIINKLKKAMVAQDDGVAIAAPQIGENIQIFVVAGRALAIIADDEEKVYDDIVFINPEIIKQSKKTEWMEEGCLSVRYLYGKVRRSTKVSVKARNENGEIFTRVGSGLLAQIFQHEIDHLNGVLFIDKAKGLKEIPPKNNGSNGGEIEIE